MSPAEDPSHIARLAVTVELVWLCWDGWSEAGCSAVETNAFQSETEGGEEDKGAVGHGHYRTCQWTNTMGECSRDCSEGERRWHQTLRWHETCERSHNTWSTSNPYCSIRERLNDFDFDGSYRRRVLFPRHASTPLQYFLTRVILQPDCCLSCWRQWIMWHQYMLSSACWLVRLTLSPTFTFAYYAPRLASGYIFALPCCSASRPRTATSGTLFIVICHVQWRSQS